MMEASTMEDLKLKLNHFMPAVSSWFSDVVSGYRKGSVAQNGLNQKPLLKEKPFNVLFE